MKFGLMYANAGPFAYPEVLTHLARTAERGGHRVAVDGGARRHPGRLQVDLPVRPVGQDPGARAACRSPIRCSALAYAAAVTKTIRLATGILILPQRHPLYVAKEVATLDVLSGGRVILGIGVGWLEEEFEALGIPFEERAARTAEAVRAMRSLWKDEPEAFDGQVLRWPPLESHPKPIQKPGVPIVVGGHTALAARRAARYGDGFFPGVADDGQARRRSSRRCATSARRSGAGRRRSRSPPGARAVDLDGVQAPARTSACRAS